MYELFDANFSSVGFISRGCCELILQLQRRDYLPACKTLARNVTEVKVLQTGCRSGPQASRAVKSFIPIARSGRVRQSRRRTAPEPLQHKAL